MGSDDVVEFLEQKVTKETKRGRFQGPRVALKMNEVRKNWGDRVFGAAKMGALFLFGVGAGVGLIYSLRPPKPPPSVLIYHIYLYTTYERITDSGPRAEFMKQRGAQEYFSKKGPWLGWWKIEVSATPAIHCPFTTGVPSRTLRFRSRMPQFDVIGIPTSHGIRTTLQFSENSRRTSHVFELKRDELREIELPREHGIRERAYALIEVEEVSPTSARALTVANPIPGGSGGS
jgi:hypothetical protein